MREFSRGRHTVREPPPRSSPARANSGPATAATTAAAAAAAATTSASAPTRLPSAALMRAMHRVSADATQTQSSLSSSAIPSHEVHEVYIAREGDRPDPVIIVVVAVLTILVFIGFAIKWSFDLLRYDENQRRRRNRAAAAEVHGEASEPSANGNDAASASQAVEDGEHIFEVVEEARPPLILAFVKALFHPREHLGGVYERVNGYVAAMRRAQTERAAAAINRTFPEDGVHPHENGAEAGAGGERSVSKPVWDPIDSENVCSICLDMMDAESHQLVYCKYGCGTFVHQTCYDRNIAVNEAEPRGGMRNPRSCPSCRSDTRLTVVPIGKITDVIAAYEAATRPQPPPQPQPPPPPPSQIASPSLPTSTVGEEGGDVDGRSSSSSTSSTSIKSDTSSAKTNEK